MSRVKGALGANTRHAETSGVVERDTRGHVSMPQWKRLATRSYLPTAQLSILLLRGTVALIFMAHALVRLVNGSAPQFAAFLEARGFPWGIVLVMMISAYEILGGLLLVLGIRVKVVCAGLAVIAVMGIVMIHRHLGWFVGEHGTGGMEFSWLLVAALLVLAITDSGGRRAGSEPPKAAGQGAVGAAMLDSTPRL